MFSVLGRIQSTEEKPPLGRRRERVRRLEITPFCECCGCEVNLDNSCLKRCRQDGVRATRLLCIPCGRIKHANQQIIDRGQKEPKLNRLAKIRNRWWRDCPYCAYCERRIEIFEATLDHKIPRTKGGSTCQDNLVLCCEICNQAKGDEDEDHFRKLILPELKHLFDLQTAELVL